MSSAAQVPEWVLIAPGARTPKAHVVEARGNGWTTLCGHHTRNEPALVRGSAEQCGKCARMHDGTWRGHAGYPAEFGKHAHLTRRPPTTGRPARDTEATDG